MSNNLAKYKPLREEETDEPLSAVLRYVVTLLGVDVAKHDQLVFDVIKTTIKRNYSALSCEEIKNAFHLLIEERLDIKKENIHHYQKFSSLFVSNVLNSFKRYRFKHSKAKPIETKPVPALTFDQARDHTEKTFIKFENREKLSDVNWTEIYKHLKTEKKINFKSEEVKPFQETVRAELIKEREYRTINSKGTIDLDLIIESKMLFYCECRKRAVLRYFTELQNIL
jgi:hypothetical protein